MSLSRFAPIVALLTFPLLLVGGLVHSTGSSLACPDWPLCFGQVFPEMTGGVLVEHSHRLYASAIGALTLVLGVWLFRREAARPWLRWSGIAAIVLVCGQGLLGGLTVIYRLPMLVSTAHLATSFFFFALLVTVSVALRPRLPSLARDVTDRTRGLAAAAVVAAYGQSVLGALVRHTGSAYACGRDPLLCDGALVPMHGAELYAPGVLHMTHRAVGYVVATLVVVAMWRLRHELRSTPTYVRGLAGGVLGLVLLQVALGLLNVWTSLHVATVTLHLGGGALLVAALTVVNAELTLARRAFAPGSSPAAPPSGMDVATLASAGSAR